MKLKKARISRMRQIRIMDVLLRKGIGSFWYFVFTCMYYVIITSLSVNKLESLRLL